MIRYLFLVFLSVKIGTGVSAQLSTAFQLSPPQLEVDSVFFFAQAKVQLALDHPGVTIRYTVDGSVVDEKSPIYSSPLAVDQSLRLRARAYHSSLQASPEVAISVRKLTNVVPAVDVLPRPAPDERYAGKGLQALSDKRKGKLAFGADPTQWLGWEVDSLRLNLRYEEACRVSTLTFSLLENHGAWIFAPEQIIIKAKGKEIGSIRLPCPEKAMPTTFRFVEVPLEAGDYRELEVLIYATRLPDWHQGKGRPAWIFLDEVLTTLQN